MKPRDRRQFAAVVAAATPKARAAAVYKVLSRLGRYRADLLPADHPWMAPLHVLAASTRAAEQVGERLVITLGEGRLILEPGVEAPLAEDAIVSLGRLFRRIRLEWLGRGLSLTLAGRPPPTHTPPPLRAWQSVARSPEGALLVQGARAVWLTAEGRHWPVESPFGARYGAWVLDLLARHVAWAPPPTDCPPLQTIQQAPLRATEDDWAVYADWLMARGEPRGRIIAQAEAGAPGEGPSALLGWWLDDPRAHLLRTALSWHRGHLLSASIEDGAGPPPLACLRACLDGPEGVALAVLETGPAPAPDAIVLIGTRPRALRRITLGLVDMPIGWLQPLIDACPRLAALSLNGTTFDFADWRLPHLESLRLEWVPSASIVERMRLDALIELQIGGTGSDLSLPALLDPAKTPALRRITFEWMRFYDPEALRRLAPALGRLERIAFMGGAIADVTPLLALGEGVRLSTAWCDLSVADRGRLAQAFGDRWDPGPGAAR